MANENKNFIDAQGGEALAKRIKKLVGDNLANDEIYIGNVEPVDPKIKLWINPDSNTGSSTTGTLTYTETVTGDGTHNYIIIEHNLGKTNVTVTVIDSVTKEVCLFDVEVIDENSIKIVSNTVLKSTDNFEISVIG